MLDASVKELSPEALSFITKIVDSQEYALAVTWVAQGPITLLDTVRRFMNAIGLSLKWQLKLHPYLYWFHPKKPVKYSEQNFEGKSDFALVLMALDNGEELDLASLSVEWRRLWKKAQRLMLVRDYVWTRNPWYKWRLAKAFSPQ